ncbi:20140_t:CDS:2, partial [Funneliformis geosporum]
MHITVNIINALVKVHSEDAIHRDLHSGNILYSQIYDNWYISDLGFYGPADKPLKCIYGNLPYIAPEVITGKEYTKASDVYSIPLEYKDLMEQCCNADPSQRPNSYAIRHKIFEMNKLYYESDEKKSIIKKFFKKINLAQQKTNATKEQFIRNLFLSDLQNNFKNEATHKKKYNIENDAAAEAVLLDPGLNSTRLEASLIHSLHLKYQQTMHENQKYQRRDNNEE